MEVRCHASSVHAGVRFYAALGSGRMGHTRESPITPSPEGLRNQRAEPFALPVGALVQFRDNPQHPLPRPDPMAAFDTQRVTSVHHWNESLFTFTCTRGTSLRFESGHFVMVGLMVADKPLMRAYSIASAHYDEELEFFSIKVAEGPLTSRLQHLKIGDEVLVGRKPTGTLVLSDLLPGRHLYLFATGTGLAPFMSIIRPGHL